MVLFIIFPFVGFYLGMKYQQMKQPKIQLIPDTKIVKIYPTETPRGLIDRCGLIPQEKLGIVYEKFRMIDGPEWAPDCRHIAWSVWQSGIMGVVNQGPYPYEGVYLYDDKTSQISKIYSFKSQEESGVFKKWTDSKTVVFQIGQKLMDFNIDSGLTLEEK
jgi:hypothetical protein